MKILRGMLDLVVLIKKVGVSSISSAASGAEPGVETDGGPGEGGLELSTKKPDVEGPGIQVRVEDPGICVKNPERLGSRMNVRFGAEEVMIITVTFGNLFEGTGLGQIVGYISCFEQRIRHAEDGMGIVWIVLVSDFR